MKPIEIRQRYDALWTQRKTVEQDWDLIEKFITPLRGGKFFQDQSSEHEIDWRRGRDVYDSTAIMAAQSLSSSLQTMLTSPSLRWFNLQFRNKQLNTDDSALEWIEDCSDKVWQALQDSNFDLEISDAYQDLVCFGTSCIVEEAESETEWNGVDFAAIPIRGVYFEQNAKGQILRMYRRIEWTPLQIIDKFGDDVPVAIKEKAAAPNQADHKQTVIYCIYERSDKKNANTSKPLAVKERPYGYKYILHESADMLGDEGGYYEMPAYLPRWQKTSGSMWGHGPGTIAISDVMTLNQTVELVLTAAAKVVDPPTLTTERGLLSDLDLNPRGMNVVRNIDDIKPYESGARFDVSSMVIEDLRMRIRQVFMVDQLELKESPAMTATEVNVRYELMQRLIAPVLGRLQTDLLSPLIERTFRILWRSGQLKELPNVLVQEGSDLDVDYVGPLANAQKADKANAIRVWLQEMAELSEFYPELSMLVEAQEAGRELAMLRGVPATVVRSKEEVDQDIEQAKQKALQQQQLETMGMGGQAMEALGKGAQAAQESELQ